MLITEPKNRGMLLDLVVFGVNAISMTILARLFADFMHQDHPGLVSQWGAALLCLALAFLQPVGAMLKRWQVHQRRPDLDGFAYGCLFHPIFYGVSKLLFLVGAASFVVMIVFNERVDGATNYFGLPPWVFGSLLLGVPALAVANTAIVYAYFRKPTRAPTLRYLQSPQSETLGDACLFLNMIGHQLFWGFLLTDLMADFSGVAERLFSFAFAALVIYLPPRLLYLAEDGRRRAAWLTMALANAPVIARILLT